MYRNTRYAAVLCTSGGLGLEVAQRLAHVDAEGHHGQGGRGHAVVEVALDVGPAGVGRAVHDELVDHLVGDGGGGGLAVAGLPGVPHRLQLRATTQPLVEGRVHGDVEVGGDGELPHGSHRARVLGRGDEDAGHDLGGGGAVGAGGGDLRHDLGHIVGGEPVDDGAVALASGQAQHARAQGSHEDLRRDLRLAAQAEALDREGVEL